MRLGLLAVLLIVPVAACSTGSADAPATEISPDTVLAIHDVAVIPMESEEVLEAHTVVVQDGRIEAVGPAGEVDVPEEALRIDGSGQYLIPGLAEMHGHLPTPSMDSEVRDAVLFLYLAQGVTTVRGMLGADNQLDMRERINAGEMVGPSLYLASPGFGGSSVEDPIQARALVRQYQETGYDLLKVHEGLDPDIYEAMAEEAHRRGIPFAGHVPDEVGLLAALEAGQHTIDHLDNYVEALEAGDSPVESYPALFGVVELAPHLDVDRLPELVEATRASGAGVVPTMALWHTFFADTPVEAYPDSLPELRYLPASMADSWSESLSDMRQQVDPERGQQILELRREILRALYEAEVPILLGSDAPQIFSVPGFSIQREMQYMQDEVGMRPYDVLVSGTRAVAQHLDLEDEFGAVAPGQRADLVLTRENPLDDVAHARNPAGVIAQGRWLPEEALSERLSDLEQQWGTAGR